jgi:hypothetical protein
MRITSQGPVKYTKFSQVKSDEEYLVHRAKIAYLRAGETLQPSDDASGAKHSKGKYYVVLRSTKALLAVYRIRAFDGVLKRLRRWPSKIEQEE